MPNATRSTSRPTSLPTPRSSFRSAPPRDVHPMYDLARRHEKMREPQFVALARAFREGGTEPIVAERLLAHYVPLISAMVARKNPKGPAGLERREDATGAAIAAFFEVLADRTVPLTPGALQKAINMRVTRALEEETLQAEHALSVSSQSAYRAARVVRTAAAVAGEGVNWLTQDEVYAILGDSIRVDSIHVIQNSRKAVSPDAKPSETDEEGDWARRDPNSDLTVAHMECPASEAEGSAERAAERIARALAILPEPAAQLLVDAHGLLGRDAVPVSDAAVALGMSVSAYRHRLSRAKSLLKTVLEEQAKEQMKGQEPVPVPRAPSAPTSTSGPQVSSGRMQRLWCASDSDRNRHTYRGELAGAMARYVGRAAAVVEQIAQREGWSTTETQAAIRRLVAFRTGCSDPSKHLLTARITSACPAARKVQPSSGEPTGVQRSAQLQRSTFEEAGWAPSSPADLEPADEERAEPHLLAIAAP